MSPETADVVVRAFLTEARKLLDEAALLARSAESLAELDHFDRAVDGAIEIPMILFKAKTALDAAALVAHSLHSRGAE